MSEERRKETKKERKKEERKKGDKLLSCRFQTNKHRRNNMVHRGEYIYLYPLFCSILENRLVI